MLRKWGTNSWLVLYDNAPAHLLVSGKGFLAKNNDKALEIPPHSTDLASSDFYQFSQLKSQWKGWRSCDTNDIIKNENEEPKRFPKK
jgi:hypothetical protein